MRSAVPLIVVRRTMRVERLVDARTAQAVRPSWLAIIVKAFCIVARDEPRLRTYYLKWPWPHFYELPKSVAMAVVGRDDLGQDATVMLKIGAADESSLADIDAAIRHGKSAPINDVPSLKKIIRITQMPLPVRRLLWAVCLNIGRQRANYVGTFAVTSSASLDVENVTARTPGPAYITFGRVHPDNTMELQFHWDHRIYDGNLVGRVLRRLEDVLNGEIVEEVLANEAARSLAV